VKLAVVDDGSFVRTYAHETRPVAATFNRFVEAVARTGEFERIRYIVPVRKLRIWELEPALDPVDESLVDIVPTTNFSGIADYLLRAGYVAGRNWRPIDDTIADSDLLWLRLPASNALLALTSARRHGVPHFAWVAGSASAVARAQPRLPLMREAAIAVGRAYDAVTELAASTGPRIELDRDLFASIVTDAEIAETRTFVASGGRHEGPWRIVFAGRMAAEKNLPDLISVVAHLLDHGRDVRLVLIGDGPNRKKIERELARLPADRVEDYGYVGDRPTYMRLLRESDVFIQPSRAEGVPKVLLEAMAAGLPIVANDAGGMRAMLGDGERGVLANAEDPRGFAAAVERLLDDADRRDELRTRGLVWAEQHTAEAQAARLISRLRAELPQLPWRS